MTETKDACIVICDLAGLATCVQRGGVCRYYAFTEKHAESPAIVAGHKVAVAILDKKKLPQDFARPCRGEFCLNVIFGVTACFYKHSSNIRLRHAVLCARWGGSFLSRRLLGVLVV